jgi:hypothetical protein
MLQQEPGAARSTPHGIGAARPHVAHHLLDLLHTNGRQVAVRPWHGGRLCRLAAQPSEAGGRD